MDDLKIAKLLNQPKMDVDYSKYENIKMAAQKRKSAGETNKLRNKKVLVTPLRAFCPVNGQSVPSHRPVDSKVLSDRKSVCPDRREALVSRRCMSETKELRDHYKPASPSLDLNIDKVKDMLKNDRDVKICQVIRKQSPVPFKSLKEDSVLGNSNTKLKTKDLKRSDSPVLERNNVKARCPSPSLDNGKRGERNQRVPSLKLDHGSKTKKNNSLCEIDRIEKNHEDAQNKPLMEIRRKLEFDNDEDHDHVAALPKGLDFTDKIAALRSLISRDRIDKTITDRKAYYNEYHSSRRKIMVSRSDSLKENNDVEQNVDNNEEIDKRLNGKTHVRQGLRAQSADIFRNGSESKNLNQMELQALKDRLEVKHARIVGGEERNSDLKRSGKSVSDDVIDETNDLLHAVSGRRVIGSTRKSKNRYDRDLDKVSDADGRPSSLESRETQTNVLNQSIRSVQSNVPFFEPQGKPGRPMSAPIFNCETETGQRKVYRQRARDLEGVDKGVKVKSGRSRSPVAEDRQSNVGDYVGTSLTPEKKSSKHRKDQKVLRNEIEIDDELAKDKQVIRRLENENLKDAGNHRPSSRCSQMGPDDEEVQKICSSSSKLRRTTKHSRSSSAFNEEFVKKHSDPYIDHCTSKSERKVREWIRKQEILTKHRSKSANFNSTPLMIEELSVSISIASNENVDMKHSPSDSCDRIPVKLEKQKNEKSYTLGSAFPGSTGYIETKNGTPDYLSNRQAIFDRLESISQAVTTQKHQFGVEVPVKGLRDKRHHTDVIVTPQVVTEQSDSGDTE